MARGYIYEMTQEKEASGFYTERDFYDDLEKLGADYVEDVLDLIPKDSLLSMFSECNAKIEPDGGIHISREVKKKYFQERFSKAKSIMRAMSLDEFAASDLYSLKAAIEDSFGDCVITRSENLQSFDRWLRTAQEGIWYIGNIILMH